MKICVFGLWHLGSVTAACLADSGFKVIGLDSSENIGGLQKGIPPLFEPGLEELVKGGLEKGNLCFTDDIGQALKGAQLVWVTFDTPVDEQDKADVGFVVKQIETVFPYLEDGSALMISSQIPVGTTARLKGVFEKKFPGKRISFLYSPENLRLGKAIDAFTRPERVVVGLEDRKAQDKIETILKPYTQNIEWMSIESAEMTKHALNAFLATSVSFINEIASLCEQVGADAGEVERGLRSDPRLGPKAFIRPGGPFAGGTLGRDISFLTQLSQDYGISGKLLGSVLESNEEHKSWVKRKLLACIPDLKGKVIAVLGLTYKPGTSTLRRSASVEMCRWIVEQGARVQAFDPAIKSLPSDFPSAITLQASAEETCVGADALVISNECEEFRDLSPEKIIESMAKCNVVDQNRFLEKNLINDPNIRYLTVGKPI